MSLLDQYLPVFKQVLYMTSEPTVFTDYEAGRQCCIDKIEQAIHDAEQQDVSEKQKELSTLAVIAWLDETILRSTLPWCQRWQTELLQRKYLNITIGGELFFTRLAELDLKYKDAREVFLFCLQHGFRGRYNGSSDLPALQALITKQRELCLPDVWQSWPNDAPITPVLNVSTGTISQHLRHLLTITAGVIVFYAILFCLLYHYIF